MIEKKLKDIAKELSSEVGLDEATIRRLIDIKDINRFTFDDAGEMSSVQARLFQNQSMLSKSDYNRSINESS